MMLTYYIGSYTYSLVKRETEKRERKSKMRGVFKHPTPKPPRAPSPGTKDQQDTFPRPKPPTPCIYISRDTLPSAQTIRHEARDQGHLPSPQATQPKARTHFPSTDLPLVVVITPSQTVTFVFNWGVGGGLSTWSGKNHAQSTGLHDFRTLLYNHWTLHRSHFQISFQRKISHSITHIFWLLSCLQTLHNRNLVIVFNDQVEY